MWKTVIIIDIRRKTIMDKYVEKLYVLSTEFTF